MMKIFDKIYNWFFDRETGKEEEWEVPFSTSGARKPEPSKSQIKRQSEMMGKWRQDFLNDCFGVIESDEQDDHALKTKYYKSKVKIFHGLQGFKWEYSHKIGTNLDFKNFDNIMKLLGYIEITKEEYEANVK